MARAPASLPPHPGIRTARRLRWMGVAFTLLALISLFIGKNVDAAGGAVLFGVTLLWLGARSEREYRAVQLHNFALDHVARGELDAAERLIEEAQRTVASRGILRRATGAQRALIALQRGDARAAVARADEAIAIRRSLLLPAIDRFHEATARGLRALAHATLRDEALARGDVEAVRANPLAPPSALASATLALSIVHANRDDMPALARELGAHPRLLEHLTPRNRTLARALVRMASPRRESAYRELASPEETALPDALESWVASMVPAAKAFVPHAVHKSRASLPPVPSVDPAALAAERKTVARASARGSARILFLWIALVSVFVGIYALVDAPAPRPTRRAVAVAQPAPSFVAAHAASGAALLFVVVMVGVYVAIGRRVRAFADAERLLVRGDDERGVAAFERLAKGPAAGGARLLLAQYRERRGDLEAALAECDRGLEFVRSLAARRRAASDLVLPGLLGERACVLAALGREADCNAALATLVNDHPGYAYMTAARLRAEMMKAVRSDDLERARAVARERTPELPLPLNDDRLFDAVLSLGEGAARGEATAVLAEIEGTDDCRRWFERTAPAVLRALRTHDLP